jgi:hypothetical protein
MTASANVRLRIAALPGAVSYDVAVTRDPPRPSIAMAAAGLEPGTSSLSGLCTQAYFPRIGPATWVNDVPLETVGDRSVPMDGGPNVDPVGRPGRNGLRSEARIGGPSFVGHTGGAWDASLRYLQAGPVGGLAVGVGHVQEDRGDGT